MPKQKHSPVKQAMLDELDLKKKEMDRVFTRDELVSDPEYALIQRLRRWVKALPEPAPKKPFVLVTVSGGVARVRATVDVDYELSARGGCMPQPAVVAERLRQRLVGAVDNDGLLEQGTGVTASRYCVAAGEIADGQRVPGRPKTCVTHHHACSCREDFFAEATGVYRKLRRVTQLSDDELMTALRMSANEVHAFRLGLAQVLARDPEMETNYDDKE